MTDSGLNILFSTAVYCCTAVGGGLFLCRRGAAPLLCLCLALTAATGCPTRLGEVSEKCWRNEPGGAKEGRRTGNGLSGPRRAADALTALSARQGIDGFAVAQQTAGAEVALGVIGLGGVGIDDARRGGGMDEAEHPGAGVHLGDDARVAYAAGAGAALEKDQIAALQLLAVGDAAPQSRLRHGASGQREAELHIHIARKAGTVESLGALAAVAVRFAEMLSGLLDQEVGGVEQRLYQVAVAEIEQLQAVGGEGDGGEEIVGGPYGLGGHRGAAAVGLAAGSAASVSQQEQYRYGFPFDGHRLTGCCFGRQEGFPTVGTSFFAIYIQRHNHSRERPEGDGEFVRVEEIVEDTVYVVGEQTEGEGDGHIGHLAVAGSAVDAHAGGKGGHEQGYHQGYARHPLLGHGADVFAVGVAEVAGIGADGGELVAALVAGIEELVGAGAAAHDGTLLPHAQGRGPTVETLQVAGIGGDVGDAFDLPGKVVGAVLVVLAKLVEDIALVDKEDADKEAEEHDHPLDLHAHAHQDVDAYGPQHAEPCRTAVGEEQAHHQEGHDGQREEAPPAFAVAADDEVEGRRQEEGYDAAVGGVVVVEGFHDAVERLEVAEVAHGLGCGDEDDGNEPYGVAPKELADALLVTENLGSGEEEGDDEPEARQPVFEGHEGHLRGAGGDEHPEHGGDEAEADGMFEQPQVVAAGGQHAEKEHQREENHHRLDGHGEFHLGHQSHVDGKGGEEGHAQQTCLEPRDKEQQH